LPRRTGSLDAGVERFVAQSFAGWPYARDNGAVKTEEDPLDPAPVPTMRESHEAIEHLEQVATDAGGIALRYGGFYGSPDDVQVELVRKRRFPIVGDGGGIFSFVHLEDAAAATAREWLPVLAAIIGAKPPRRVPPWLARLVADEAAVMMMTESPGVSNAKAKRELGWRLRYPSWREGFRAAYDGAAAKESRG
jgi:nucleoside-diphosphate-sugar epimerase